jgi:outer membrane protein OmpA-like peptidoglycan-associated protein
MAWNCKRCGTAVPHDDEDACPECGASKFSWTIGGANTRNFRVTTRTKKLLPMRGVDVSPGPSGASYEPVDVVETSKALAIPKADAIAWKDQDLLPPPEQVLFARLIPSSATASLDAFLSVHYDTQEIEEHEVPAPEGAAANEGGYYDVRFLFVYGPDPLPPEVTFAGLTVIDISEENEEGFAPTVGVRALGRRRRDLPVEGFARQVRRLACAKIRFNTDSAIFMPDGLGVVAAALDVVADEPELRVLIVSHTDTMDSDAKNLSLSQARSENVLNLVIGEKKAWAELAERENSHKNQDVREVLAWAAELWNWDCHPGAVDNTPPPDEAVKAFKAGFRKTFSSNHTPRDEDPAVDYGFWRRTLNLYGRVLMDRLGVQDAVELRKRVEAMTWVDEERPAVGCGEHYNLDDQGNNANVKENRRTEFLFFTQEDLPAVHGAEDPVVALAPVYKSYGILELPCPEPTFFGRPVPEGNVVFVIDFSGSMSPSDRDGIVVRPDRVGYAKRNLNQAIRDLSEDTYFTVVGFNRLSFSCWKDKEATEWTPELRQATDENKGAAIGWVNRRRAQSNTNTKEALEQAFRSTGGLAGAQTRVIFLTDGAPTPRARFNASSERQKLLDENRDRQPTWILDTIGFFQEGKDPGAALPAFLRSLADDHGGEFTEVYVKMQGQN